MKTHKQNKLKAHPVGTIVPWGTWKANRFYCVCGETRSRFGPQIDGLGTWEFACGHTWAGLGREIGMKRLNDFAVKAALKEANA